MYSRGIDTFICVADAGSFTKAAAGLYISTSSVVQQINLLEEKLGVSLFVRTNHGVRLTDAGEVFLRDARQIVALFKAAQARIDEGKRQLRVASGRLLGHELFALYWKKLKPRLPDVSVSFVELPGIASMPEEPVLREMALMNWEGASGLLFEEVCRTPLVIALPPGHRLIGRTSIGFGDLAGETIAFIRRGVAQGADDLRHAIEANCPHTRLVDSPIYNHSFFNECKLSRYLIMLPACWHDLYPSYEVIPCDWPYTMPYGFVYRADLSPAIQRFIKEAKALSRRTPDLLKDVLWAQI